MTFAAAALICFAATAEVDGAGRLDPAGYAFSAPLVNESQVTGFVRLRLPAEVVDRLQPSWSDLRIADGSGKVVPYVLEQEPVTARGPASWTAGKPAAPVLLEGDACAVTVEMKEGVRNNRMLLVTAASEPLPVRVEGSDDGQQWAVLLDGDYRIQASETAHGAYHRQLPLPENSHRWFRLVFAPGDVLWSGQRVSGVRVGHEAPLEQGRLMGVSATRFVPEEDASAPKLAQGQNAHAWTLGWRNLEAVRVRVLVADPYFERDYTMEQSTNGKYWQRIASGTLHRVRIGGHTFEDVDVPVPFRTPARLRLVVQDGDNPPLEVQGMEILARTGSLLLDSSGRTGMTLYFGNASAGPVRYDLSRAVRTSDMAGVPELCLGAVTQREAVKAPAGKPWTEQHQGLLWAGLAVAIAAMLFVVLRTMASMGPVNAEDQHHSGTGDSE